MRRLILKLKHSSPAGFSLIELMIAMIILLSMIAILSSILVSINYQFRTQRPRLEAINNGQMAVDTITRLIRMAGNRPVNCSFSVLAPTASSPLGGGIYARLRIQADWNPADCTLNGAEEDVTFSVNNGVLYLDANQQIPFVERISALRFQFYDEDNALISDPVTRSAEIAFIRVEVDTLAADGTSPTITGGASIRK
jgi:prepilin-type N-terminal cleavage/methylation domain-containing protein